MNDIIYTPISQGTLRARLVWNNEANRDGIEISMRREDGTEQVLAVISAGQDGLVYDIAMPLDDMDSNVTMSVFEDEQSGILRLQSSPEQGDQNS